jgi:pimeloyl-ACP methyl ester carboxylesterase
LIEIDGRRLHYLEWGAGRRRSILLLHGIGDNAHIWDHCASDLSRQGLRVIALDQRGHGLSDWADPPGYGCGDYVADLKKFIKELDLAGFVLMGHSMGALHATLYAALEPQRVAGLVHADIEPCPPAWNKKYLLNLYNELPFFFDSIDDYVETIRKNYLHADLKMLYEIASHEAVRGEDGKLRTRFDREVLSHFDPSYDICPYLGRISCPTLVIRGRESRVMSEDAARQMSSSIRRGEFAQVENAAHPLHIDNPGGFQQEISGFLRGIGFRRAP